MAQSEESDRLVLAFISAKDVREFSSAWSNENAFKIINQLFFNNHSFPHASIYPI